MPHVPQNCRLAQRESYCTEAMALHWWRHVLLTRDVGKPALVHAVNGVPHQHGGIPHSVLCAQLAAAWPAMWVGKMGRVGKVHRRGRSQWDQQACAIVWLLASTGGLPVMPGAPHPTNPSGLLLVSHLTPAPKRRGSPSHRAR